jgi:hypothetical protein
LSASRARSTPGARPQAVLGGSPWKKPNADTVARYEALLPADPRLQPGKMFGHVCAFVGGHMFFGTFAQTLIARVGVRARDGSAGAGRRQWG